MISVPPLDMSKQEPFIKLVDKILAAQKANPNADTSTLENKIDQLVYKLYDFNEEEIKSIKNS